MVRILTARSVREAQPCGLRPSLLGHAPVTAPRPPGKLASRRLCAKRRLRPRHRERLTQISPV